MMKEDGEDFSTCVCTSSTAELHAKFYRSFGGIPDAESWTAWGEEWVYFPLEYDSMHFVGHAPRHPSGVRMDPQ